MNEGERKFREKLKFLSLKLGPARRFQREIYLIIWVIIRNLLIFLEKKCSNKYFKELKFKFFWNIF